MTHNSIEVLTAENGYAEVCTVLSDDGRNLNGYAHGGLISALADCAAGIAAKTDDRDYVTQTMNVSYISNIREGTLYARGAVVSSGKTIVVIRVTICNGTGRLIADASLNMFCIAAKDPTSPRTKNFLFSLLNTNKAVHDIAFSANHYRFVCCFYFLIHFPT